MEKWKSGAPFLSYEQKDIFKTSKNYGSEMYLTCAKRTGVNRCTFNENMRKKTFFCIFIPKAFVLFLLEIFHHFLAAHSKILNFFLLRLIKRRYVMFVTNRRKTNPYCSG